MTITWNTLQEKLKRSNCENLHTLIKNEFGDLHGLAFAILEAYIWDTIKYTDISFSITGNEVDGYKHMDAIILNKKLELFKKAFNEKYGT